ncbi:MAG: hypothetical protein LUG60_00265 [Erysipelotrichaceae bacterium]|nr:hypothetical protein [Erysipelotrichaceae bacterium]
MKTKNEEKKLLEKGLITESQYARTLNSINKRAKNCRDKISEYEIMYPNWSRYKYKTIGNYRNKMNEYYEMKEILLTCLSPVGLHKSIYKNKYGKEIKYFKYYELRGYGYHKPIDKEKFEKLSGKYEITTIDNLYVDGEHDITSLVSNQFAKKVVYLVEKGKISIIPDENVKEMLTKNTKL